MQSSIALLALCFVLGIVFRRFFAFPDNAIPVLNAWMLRVALPALVLRVIHDLNPAPALVPAALSLWVVFGFSVVIALLLMRLNVLTRAQAGGFALAAGTCNTAFVGLPFIEGLGGHAGLEVAVVVDQLGSFTCLSILAIPFAANMAGQGLPWHAVAKRVLTFPPLIALVFALVLRSVVIPPWLDSGLHRLGDTLSPIALFTVGYQLRIAAWRGRTAAVAGGLVYKLAVAPLMVAGILRLLDVTGLPFQVTVTQAAMAPMVTAAVIANEYDLDGEFAALMVGVGVPLSFITAAWVWALA